MTSTRQHLAPSTSVLRGSAVPARLEAAYGVGACGCACSRASSSAECPLLVARAGRRTRPLCYPRQHHSPPQQGTHPSPQRPPSAPLSCRPSHCVPSLQDNLGSSGALRQAACRQSPESAVHLLELRRCRMLVRVHLRHQHVHDGPGRYREGRRQRGCFCRPGSRCP